MKYNSNKILYKRKCLVVVARFFSGLDQIIETGIWGHSGSPAYYNFINKIDKDTDIDCELILLSIRQGAGKVNEKLYLDGLNHPITIIPYYTIPLLNRFMDNPRIGIFYNKIIQSFKVLIITKGYTCYYIDRDNFILAALILKLKKSLVVVRLLGVTDSVYSHLRENKNILSSIIQYVFNHCNAKIICSNDGSYAEIVSRDYARNKFNLLFNGVSKNKVKTNGGELSNVINVVYISRVERNKGHEDFLYAIKKITSDREYKVLIVGDGTLLSKYEKLVRELELEGVVEFTGRIPHDNVMGLINNSHFMVSINYDGVFGNNVLEASQLMLPVIALDHPGCLNSAKNNFYLIPRTEIVKNITMAMSKMIESPDLRKEYSRKSRKFSEIYLSSWQDRINDELNYIKEYCFS